MRGRRLACFGALVLSGCSVSAQTPDPWVFASASGPIGVGQGAVVYDSLRDRAVYFGGYPAAQTWEWDGSAWVQRLVPGPPPRIGLAMAFDSARGVTVLFGGIAGTELGDTWEWNGQLWTQVSNTGPRARKRHAMAFDTVRSVTVLVGGDVSTGKQDDCWEWNGSAWAGNFAGISGGLTLSAMAYDPSRQVMVLFGGRNFETTLGDTWERVGTQWIRRQVPGPPARYGHQMTYDPVRSLTLLMGGSVFTGPQPPRGTWEWNGTTWRGTNDNPPSVYLAYDSARSRLVGVGGNRFGSSELGTWVRPSTLEFCYANCDGSTVAPVLNVADFICFLNNFAARRGHANCDGDTACTYTVNDFQCFMNRYAEGCP